MLQRINRAAVGFGRGLLSIANNFLWGWAQSYDFAVVGAGCAAFLGSTDRGRAARGRTQLGRGLFLAPSAGRRHGTGARAFQCGVPLNIQPAG